MKDGLVLFYVKDGTILPVALTQEQSDTFDMLMGIMPGTIRVIDKPQGTAINLMDEKKKPSAPTESPMEISQEHCTTRNNEWTASDILRQEG
ncbi:MAG TPA: hypothetical protein VFC84_00305 [Desulfosporosinus sp.]|nr:hypothetical protein [Desulfosporosinus sp.]